MTEETLEKLKPCLFCGQEKHYLPNISNDCWEVICDAAYKNAIRISEKKYSKVSFKLNELSYTVTPHRLARKITEQDTRIKELEEALESAVKMHEWVCTRINQTEYRMEEKEEGLPESLQEMFDSMRDGLMASYRDEFGSALSKNKKGSK